MAPFSNGCRFISLKKKRNKNNAHAINIEKNNTNEKPVNLIAT